MNPFPKPDTISKDIDNEIRNIIEEQFKMKTLDFHVMLKYLEDIIEQKNLSKANICAYYITNVVLTTSFFNKLQKEQVIMGLVESISDLEYELSTENPKRQKMSDLKDFD